MKQGHTSKVALAVNTTATEIWEALVNSNTAKRYFWGADIQTDWQAGSSILFKGEFNGNKYEEKGVILEAKHCVRLQYTHWSDQEGLPDTAEHYRTWTFDLAPASGYTTLTITEDNIPTMQQKERSDEFWTSVLSTIKEIVER